MPIITSPSVELTSDEIVQIMSADPVSAVIVASKSFAFNGTNTMVWVANGARSKSVVVEVAKQAGYCREYAIIGSGQGVGAAEGRSVGEVLGL